MAIDHYNLSLHDRSGWSLSGTGEAVPWLSHLASIARLKKRARHGVLKEIACIEKNSCPPKPGEMPPAARNFSFIETLPGAEWNMSSFRSLRLWSHSSGRCQIVEIPEPGRDYLADLSTMNFLIALLTREVTGRGGFPLHGALVEKEGRGIILAGHGGAGKSTCCARIPPPWKVLCDDMTLVVKNGDGRYYCHPLPTWSDLWLRNEEKSWPIEHSVPLSLILFIEQASRDELVPAGEGMAAVRITEAAEQASFLGYEEGDAKRGLRRELFDNAAHCAKNVPAALIKVSLTGRFWEKIEEALTLFPAAAPPSCAPRSHGPGG